MRKALEADIARADAILNIPARGQPQPRMQSEATAPTPTPERLALAVMSGNGEGGVLWKTSTAERIAPLLRKFKRDGLSLYIFMPH